MTSFTSLTISLLSIGTLAAQILAGIFFLFLMFRLVQPKDKSSKRLVNLISDNHMAIIFVITAGATVGSLILSEALGFPPCKLCWYQRIAIYPQMLISGVALITADENVRKYLLPMSVIGALIAIYHILVQALPGIIQCGDEVVSCSSKQFAGFGYITIPVMSLTAFVILILIYLTTFDRFKK